jgi:hypothetical protein
MIRSRYQSRKDATPTPSVLRRWSGYGGACQGRVRHNRAAMRWALPASSTEKPQNCDKCSRNPVIATAFGVTIRLLDSGGQVLFEGEPRCLSGQRPVSRPIAVDWSLDAATQRRATPWPEKPQEGGFDILATDRQCTGLLHRDVDRRAACLQCVDAAPPATVPPHEFDPGSSLRRDEENGMAWFCR